MIETNSSVYITIQNPDLISVITKHAIKKRNQQTNIEFFPEYNILRFSVNDMVRADLYNSVPESEVILKESIMFWINEIIATIPSEAIDEFSVCVKNAEYIEMIVNWECFDDPGNNNVRNLRGVWKNGKYKRTSKALNQYEPSREWGFPKEIDYGYLDKATVFCLDLSRRISKPISEIQLPGKTFVHTACETEDQIDEYVLSHGGTIRASTVLNTDYIIIGNDIHTISEKAGRALYLNFQRGKSIKAITEEEFWAICGGLGSASKSEKLPILNTRDYGTPSMRTIQPNSRAIVPLPAGDHLVSSVFERPVQSGSTARSYTNDAFESALTILREGNRALALETYDFSQRLAKTQYMLFGLKRNGTVCSKEIHQYNFGNWDTNQWNDVVMLATTWDSIFGLRADGTVLEAGVVDWVETERERWKEITSILTTQHHIMGLKKDGTCLAYGFNGWNGSDQSHIQLSDDWRDIMSITDVDFALYGLRKDGTVVVSNSAGAPDCNWSNIKSLYATSGANHSLIGLRTDGSVVLSGNADGTLGEMQYWNGIVSLSTTTNFSYGLRDDGTVLLTGKLIPTDCLNVRNWRDIIFLSANNSNVVGLKKDGTVVAAGYDFENNKNPVSHIKNAVLVYLNDQSVIALTAEGAVSSSDSFFRKITDSNAGWKLW